MQTVIVLFNLKSGVSREEFETWARTSDIPLVRALPSMQAFDVLRASGLLIGEGESPYEYIEIMRIPDMEAFSKDLADPAVQAGAAQFQKYADNPLFILAGEI